MMNNKKISTVGFDFLVTGEQHHFYHIGMLQNNIINRLYLSKSCMINDEHHKSVIGKVYFDIEYRSYVHLILTYIWYRFFRVKHEIHIVGTKTRLIPMFCFYFVGSRTVIHLHGQIGTIVGRKAKLWRIFANFCDFVVANPIYDGPSFVKCIGNASFFKLPLQKKTPNKKVCLIYGANKSFLHSKSLRNLLKLRNFEILSCISESGDFVSTGQILRLAEYATHTVLSLKYDHYKLSPSGRIADLAILSLTPLVLDGDIDTMKVLNAYDISYEILRYE